MSATRCPICNRPADTEKQCTHPFHNQDDQGGAGLNPGEPDGGLQELRANPDEASIQTPGSTPPAAVSVDAALIERVREEITRYETPGVVSQGGCVVSAADLRALCDAVLELRERFEKADAAFVHRTAELNEQINRAEQAERERDEALADEQVSE